MKNGIELELLTANDNWENLEWYTECPICCGQGSLSAMVADGYNFDLDDWDLQDAMPALKKEWKDWLWERFEDQCDYHSASHVDSYHDWCSELSWSDFDFEDEDDLPFLRDALVELGVIEEGDFDLEYSGSCQYCDGEGNNDALYWSYVWETYVAGSDYHEAAKTARRHGCYLFGDGYTWYIVFQGCGFDASWVLMYGAYKIAGYLQDDFTPESTGGSVFVSDDERKLLATETVEKLDREASWLNFRNDLARMAGMSELVARVDVPRVGIDNEQTVLRVALDLEQHASDARVEIYKRWALNNVPVSENNALLDMERAAKLLLQEVKNSKRELRKLYWFGVRSDLDNMWVQFKYRVVNSRIVRFWREAGTK